MKAFFSLSLFSLGAHLRCRGGFSLSGSGSHAEQGPPLCARAAVVTHPCSINACVTFWHFQQRQAAWEKMRDAHKATASLSVVPINSQKDSNSLCTPLKRPRWLPWRLFHSPNKGVFYESSAAFFKESLLFLRGGLRNSLFSRFARIITPPLGGISLPRPPLCFFPCPSRGWQLSAKRIKMQVSLFSKYTHNPGSKQFLPFL